MNKNPRELRLSPLASAISHVFAGVSTLLFVGYASAQAPPAADEPEEIVVTGSRIQRTSGFHDGRTRHCSHAEELSTFQPGRTMADQLDQLPQFYATQSAQRGGGALFGSAGISTLNMRAMGPQRTLVLVDGARVSPADRDGSVHVDNIPTALMSQVEVVTGGASAAYGADALAGVVNFRINRNYEGLDLNVGRARPTQASATKWTSRSLGARSSAIVGTSSARSRTRISTLSTRTPTTSATGSAVTASSGIRPGRAQRATRRSRSGSCCPTFIRPCIRRPAGRRGGECGRWRHAVLIGGVNRSE